MNNVTIFITFVSGGCQLDLVSKKKNPRFGLIFKKSCMPKIESTSDLKAIYSFAKTRLKTLIINATKLLTLTHISVYWKNQVMLRFEFVTL
jgi:hypothetical protein